MGYNLHPSIATETPAHIMTPDDPKTLEQLNVAKFAIPGSLGMKNLRFFVNPLGFLLLL